MDVKDVMTTNLITVGPDASFKDIVEHMVRSRISGIPVVDESGTLLGIVTEGDLLPREARQHPHARSGVRVLADVLLGHAPDWVAKAEALTARALMTEHLTVARPGEDVRVAARRMLDARVKRLPVVEDDRLVGIVSRVDLLGVFLLGDAEIQAAIEQLLYRGQYVAPEHDIHVRVRDGVVTLDGSVLRRSDVGVVGAVAAGADGVIEVVNELGYQQADPKHPERPTPLTRGIT